MYVIQSDVLANIADAATQQFEREAESQEVAGSPRLAAQFRRQAGEARRLRVLLMGMRKVGNDGDLIYIESDAEAK